MVWLGAHIGIAEGLAQAPAIGRKIGCEAIQIFSKSPQMWGAAPIAADVAEEFRNAVRKEGLHTLAVHQSYLPNLASPNKTLLTRSRNVFVDELRRAELLGIPLLIFHPGAHTGAGVESGLRTIVESIDWAVGQTPSLRVRALLENAAGQGTTLGSRPEELAWILDHVSDRSRVGVALDTCHLFASGIDFRTEQTYAELKEAIERCLGLSEVHAFHFNDSRGPLGCRLDRHENIGKGAIRLEGFRPIVTDRRWDKTPGYLETPLGDDGYGAYERDLRALRGLLGKGRPGAPRAPRSRAGRPRPSPS